MKTFLKTMIGMIIASLIILGTISMYIMVRAGQEVGNILSYGLRIDDRSDK